MAEQTTDNKQILKWPEDQMPKLSKREARRLRFLNRWGWAFDKTARKRHLACVKQQKEQRAQNGEMLKRIMAYCLYEWGFFDDANERQEKQEKLVYVYPPEMPSAHDKDYQDLRDCILAHDELKAKLTPAEVEALTAMGQDAEVALELNAKEAAAMYKRYRLPKKGRHPVTILRPTTDAAPDLLREILALHQADREQAAADAAATEESLAEKLRQLQADLEQDDAIKPKKLILDTTPHRHL